MNCPKCGGEVLNDRCMQCGETVQQPQDPQQGYQPPNYQDYQQNQQGYQQQPDYSQQQPGYQPPPPPPNTLKHPKSTTNIVIGIIQIVLCCGPGIITGILMLVWNSNLDTAYRNGNLPEVQRLEKNIKTAMIVGFVVSAVLYILYFAAVGGLMSLGYMY